MGMTPDYIFNFAVAERNSPRWREIPVEQLEWPLDAVGRLREVWVRIWRAPEDAPGSEAVAD
jgi:inner membrane protein